MRRIRIMSVFGTRPEAIKMCPLVLAMERELKNPSEEEIKEYLAGNLCRCSGYMSQLRAIRKYLLEKGGQG